MPNFQVVFSEKCHFSDRFFQGGRAPIAFVGPRTSWRSSRKRRRPRWWARTPRREFAPCPTEPVHLRRDWSDRAIRQLTTRSREEAAARFFLGGGLPDPRPSVYRFGILLSPFRTILARRLGRSAPATEALHQERPAPAAPRSAGGDWRGTPVRHRADFVRTPRSAR